MESLNTTSVALALPDEETMLSESCTQTDSLSLPLTVDLGTQTDNTNSLDEHENPAIDADNVNAISSEEVSGFCAFFFLFCVSGNPYIENMFICIFIL